MPDCPNCQASLDDDFAASTGVAECPFCGAEISEADFGPSFSDRNDALVPANANAGSAELPSYNRIRVIESTDRQLVIFVPPGGKRARGLGFFALVWNGFMALFTSGWIFAGDAPEAGSLLFVCSILSVFWLVGLVVFVIWIQMSFTRIFLLLQRDRLTLQRILFGRKTMKDTNLNQTSRAQLIESYQQNDDPVYKVVVNGTNGSASFGTGLAPEEKEWLVEQINEFLGTDAAPTFDSTSRPAECSECGAALAGQPDRGGEIVCPQCQHRVSMAASTDRNGIEAVVEMNPDALPDHLAITVDEAFPERLRLHFAVLPPSTARTVCGICSIGFGMLWIVVPVIFALRMAGPWQQLQGDVIATLLFGQFFALFGFVPLLLGWFILRGRTTIEVTGQRIGCRWHLGLLGFRKTLPTAAITHVGKWDEHMQQMLPRKSLGRHRRSHQAGQPGPFYAVFAGQRMIPLTFLHDPDFGRAIAGLILYQLRIMGIRLDDA